MTDFSTMDNARFIRAGFTAAESPVGGGYTRMWLREALRRLEIADTIADDLRRAMEEGEFVLPEPAGENA